MARKKKKSSKRKKAKLKKKKQEAYARKNAAPLPNVQYVHLARQAIQESSWDGYKIRYMLQNRQRTVWPRSFFEKITSLECEKTIDYIFIGNINAGCTSLDEGRRRRSQLVFENRKWILRFIEYNFTNESFLQFTDENTLQLYESARRRADEEEGIFQDKPYDYTNKAWREEIPYVPREVENSSGEPYFDLEYFKKMNQAKFCLCPGGDSPWSYRFYEAIMCKCIPIIHSPQEGPRTRRERRLGYKCYFRNDAHVYDESIVKHNLEIFEKESLLVE
jgi:hypothetical protein